MAFQYLTNIPLEQARSEFRKCLQDQGFSPRTEAVPVQDACGRVTAGPVYARICAPHYPASAMDGIALAVRATFGATETTPVTLTERDFTPIGIHPPTPAWAPAW